MDFFTPRFYESAAFYCKMLGRYSENKEAELLDIKAICSNVRSYEEFERRLDFLLDKSSDFLYDSIFQFANNNKTSKRASEMLNKLIQIQSKDYG